MKELELNNNPHLTNNPDHAKFKDKDRGAGLIVYMNIIDGPESERGLAVYAGSSFRGINFTTGGSSLNEGTLDEFYYQTAAREFEEESFAKLAQMDDSLLKETLSSWKLPAKSIDEVVDALTAMSETNVYTNLLKATSAEALSLTTPVESGPEAKDYKRVTYQSQPFDVGRNDLNKYLANATRVAGILSKHYRTRSDDAKNELIASGITDPDRNTISKKRNEDNPGLSDYTESSKIGFMLAKDAYASVALYHGAKASTETSAEKTEVEKDGKVKPVIHANFISAEFGSHHTIERKLSNLEVFGASLKVISGFIPSMEKLNTKESPNASRVIESRKRSSSEMSL